MALIVYSALLALGLVLATPWWLSRMLTSGRYREGLTQRLGRVPATFKPGKNPIWIHAVSVGEVLAASRLITELAATNAIVLSTTTATGQAIARERFPAIPVFYFPLDFAFAIRPWLHAINPRALLLVEGELWPRLLAECDACRIPVAVVNARISDRSYKRTIRFKSLWLRMAKHITLWFPQSHETKARLEQLGIPAARILTPGNLKYDTPPPSETPLMAALRAVLPLKTQLVICGSTLPGEEKIILEAWPKILKLRPHARLLLAPRHPDRFTAVATLIQQTGYPAILLGQLPPTAKEGIFLLDSLGSLAALYQLAAVAFIGGSLAGQGGHNVLEPSRFAVPTLTGPSYENFREMVHDMLAAEAIRVVSPSRLAEAILAMLFDGAPMGRRAQTFYESQRGATARTLQALQSLLK